MIYIKTDTFIFALFLSELHCPLREIRVALTGLGTAAARAALPVCATFPCVDFVRTDRCWNDP